ncbi:hypothetical protein ONZ45_g6009 [Pleurotus djamor]|nr:hypothetical protein ONZ45_g6009 [Pleurotus djamor]
MQRDDREDSVEEHPSSPTSPFLEDTVRLAPEFVLAMHDYAPQHQSATCLSFRAGQVIHVLNRDTSGWWDGELEGRRGWFPSNYVSSHVDSLTEEALPDTPARQRKGHTHSMSTSSVTSWATASSSENAKSHSRRPSTAETAGSEGDTYPPLMINLLHGLSLLQNACLPKDAPLLQQFQVLAIERKRILSVLAALVTQAKKASETDGDEENREYDIEVMLRLGGQVFAYVRRFLAVAVQCGIDLPDRRDSMISVTESTDTEGPDEDNDTTGSISVETTAGPSSSTIELIATTGETLRARSPAGRYPPAASNGTDDEFDDAGMPLLPHRSVGKLNRARFPVRDRLITRHKPGMSSVDSTSSSSSFSSLDSNAPPPKSAFPAGPTSAAQVLEALRSTHDRYLSTIAAFIGHAHSHSRSSHASSTGHMYDLVREIVENVCKLLTIVEAVLGHPDIPTSKVFTLKQAKDGLYTVTSELAESVRLLTVQSPTSMSEEDEKQLLLRSATAALKSGADCVAAVKVCLGLNRGSAEPFVIKFPDPQDGPSSSGFTTRLPSSTIQAISGYPSNGVEDEDLTIQAQTPPSRTKMRGSSSGSDQSILSQLSSQPSEDTAITTPDDHKPLPPLTIPMPDLPIEPDLPSPTSMATRTDDGTTWEGSARGHGRGYSVDEKRYHGQLPAVPLEVIQEATSDPIAWMLLHDHPQDEVAYNSEGVLVGASLDVLVERMTPYNSIVDHAFASVFFMTFRLFASPVQLVEKLLARYNLQPPLGLNDEEVFLWERQKGAPIRLRVSNFVKTWVEFHWRSLSDDAALPGLTEFVMQVISRQYPGPAARILEVLDNRRQHSDFATSPRGGRDPSNTNAPAVPQGEVPRPTMTKTLLSALRSKNFASISITDFDALELARQMTVMECNLYCAILPEEVLETGQEGAKALNVRAVSTLSTLVTGWVAESILAELDLKKRTALVKFFIKVADYFSVNSGCPGFFHDIKTPPNVVGLYLTDVTFCREGNQSYRVSPRNPDKKLINFNKYHKLARIVQDMQRFQIPYNLKAINEVHEYLNAAFENSKRNGDLQDLYRRSLEVEPKQPADAPPVSDMRQLFNWTTRTQLSYSSS